MNIKTPLAMKLSKKIKRTVVIFLYVMMLVITIAVVLIVIWINIKNKLH